MRRRKRQELPPMVPVQVKLDASGNPCPSWCTLDQVHWHDEIVSYRDERGPEGREPRRPTVHSGGAGTQGRHT